MKNQVTKEDIINQENLDYSIKHKVFKSESELIDLLNNDLVRLVALTQAKNNDYNLFYKVLNS
jgi:hypothetical protein